MSLLNKKRSGNKCSMGLKVTRVFIITLFLFLSSGIAFASSDGGHGDSAEPKGWVKEDTYRVMNFAVLFIALFAILRKPASEALNNRIKGIQEQLDDLEAQKNDAEAKLSKYTQKISKLDKEAEEIIAGYKKQGEDVKAKILKEAEAAATKLEDQARRTIEHEFMVAKLKLQEEILEEALIKAEEIVKSKITIEDQDRLVDEYLDKVVLH